jgi:hypothetical protein
VTDVPPTPLLLANGVLHVHRNPAPHGMGTTWHVGKRL